ncbi:MAG: hypothetical protein R3F30_08965 [Planctomycetota bacterium]
MANPLRRASRSWPAILSALFLVGATLPAQVVPPLDEERRLEDREVLLEGEYQVNEKGTPNVIGLRSTKLEKAILDGATVYLLQREGQEAVLDQGRIREVGERSLWDAELDLIAMAVMRPDREEDEVEEFRWEDGGLEVREGGSSRGEKLRCPARPDAPVIVQLRLRPPVDGKKRALETWDPSSRHLVKVELVHDEQPWKFNDKPAIRYHYGLVGGPGIFVDEASRCMLKREHQRLPLTIQRSAADREARQKALLHNESLARALRDQIVKTWKFHGRTITNDRLGLRLRKPKEEWGVEQPKPLPDVLKIENYANQAWLLISVVPAWPGRTLDDYADDLVKQRSGQMDPHGKHDRGHARLGALSAVRIEYSETDHGRQVDTCVHLGLEDGLLIRIEEVAHMAARQPQRGELEDIRKTVRFKRR